MRSGLLVLGLTGLLSLVAVGCGEDEEETTNIQPPAVAEAESLEEPPPKRSSLLLKEIYRQFQPPKPNPEVKGSVKAIRRGEAACRGKTPQQVKAQFIGESDLSDDQRKAVSELGKIEENPSASFPAGQLAALVYQMTLSNEELAPYGFQGCVYALSLPLKRKLAPR